MWSGAVCVFTHDMYHSFNESHSLSWLARFPLQKPSIFNLLHITQLIDSWAEWREGKVTHSKYKNTRRRVKTHDVCHTLSPLVKSMHLLQSIRVNFRFLRIRSVFPACLFCAKISKRFFSAKTQVSIQGIHFLCVFDFFHFPYLQVDFAETSNDSTSSEISIRWTTNNFEVTNYFNFDFNNDDENNVVDCIISLVLGFNWKTATLEGKIFSAVNSFLTASSKEIRQLMVSVGN